MIWSNFSISTRARLRFSRSSLSALSKLDIVSPSDFNNGQLYRSGVTRGTVRAFSSRDRAVLQWLASYESAIRLIAAGANIHSLVRREKLALVHSVTVSGDSSPSIVWCEVCFCSAET
jgi:hypothetical protein